MIHSEFLAYAIVLGVFLIGWGAAEFFKTKTKPTNGGK